MYPTNSISPPIPREKKNTARSGALDNLPVQRKGITVYYSSWKWNLAWEKKNTGAWGKTGEKRSFPATSSSLRSATLQMPISTLNETFKIK